MSEIKVNKISPRSGTGVALGDSGDTFTVPSGGAITIASGATITNSGTAVNFGATGSASWTSTVKTSTFTAVAGEGYFVDTTSGAVTVNLPAGSAGAVVAIKDYLNTFDTNAVTLVANGSEKISGSTDNKKLDTEGIAVTIVYIDSTRGWLVTDDGLESNLKDVSYTADFLCIAGGGGGNTGGAGAGGYSPTTPANAPGNNGQAGSGSGGGAGVTPNSSSPPFLVHGGNGGSGLVMIAYPQ